MLHHHRNRDHFHQGGRLPNVCVSHAANSSLTGLLSSHLGLQYTLPIVFLPFLYCIFFTVSTAFLANSSEPLVHCMIVSDTATAVTVYKKHKHISKEYTNAEFILSLRNRI